jgi:hypothetical protein
VIGKGSTASTTTAGPTKDVSEGAQDPGRITENIKQLWRKDRSSRIKTKKEMGYSFKEEHNKYP